MNSETKSAHAAAPRRTRTPKSTSLCSASNKLKTLAPKLEDPAETPHELNLFWLCGAVDDAATHAVFAGGMQLVQRVCRYPSKKESATNDRQQLTNNEHPAQRFLLLKTPAPHNAQRNGPFRHRLCHLKTTVVHWPNNSPVHVASTRGVSLLKSSHFSAAAWNQTNTPILSHALDVCCVHK